MNVSELQIRLQRSGRYTGKIDDDYGPQTRAAVLLAMTDGPDTRIDNDDIDAAAGMLNVDRAHIRAVLAVEASGAGFTDGRPSILFEPHRFSRATKHRYDATHPAVSYRDWDPKRYPKSQGPRYGQLVEAVGLDVDAGFASASYGLFQILGENHALVGFGSAFEFAVDQARDEGNQLTAFVRFVRAKGLRDALARVDQESVNAEAFCRGYNGTAFRKNDYHLKLAAAYTAALVV